MNVSSVMTSERTKRLVISAMFLAIALVVRTFFRMYIPLFGESGMRIGIHGIFSAVPAILFGPVYGAIVSGLTDFIGFHLSPTGGAWLPQLTLTAALGGFVRGGLWMLLQKRRNARVRDIVVVVSVILLSTGLFGMASFTSDGITRDFYEPYTLGSYVNDEDRTVWLIDREQIDTAQMSTASRMAIYNSIYTENPAARLRDFIMLLSTMIGSGAFGLLLVGVDWLVNRFIIKDETGFSTLSLLVAMMAAAVLVSTLNTMVLRTVLPAWRLLPFTVLWLPRVMQTAATTILMTYIISLLLIALKKSPYQRW